MHDEIATLDSDILRDRAFAAWDRGELKEASGCFAELLRREPEDADYHYMRGLVHKYMRDWRGSLHHNQRSQALRDEPDDATLWNAGIAATALGDWAEARRAWAACGINVPEGEGPIDGDFGICSIRLNAWDEGETVYAHRIDVVRARLLNVPLPESGYRCGDIVLHDGARTGERPFRGGTVPVLNAMARLIPSEFQTFTVFVSCPDAADVAALLQSSVPGIAHIEDWTETVRYYCLRCSYGVPHKQHANEEDKGGVEHAWEPDRNLGISAQSRRSVEKLLKDWSAKGRGRSIDGIEARECMPGDPEDGVIWWREPDFDGDEEEEAGTAG